MISVAQKLNDGRQVYLGGSLVNDFECHPAFSGLIGIIDSYYRLQSEEPEVHTATEGSQSQFAISLLIPRTSADLKAKRESYKRMADLSFGMLGRTPDFMNAGVMALGAHSSILGQDSLASYSENAQSYLAWCRKNNIFVGHGAINPQLGSGGSSNSLGHSHAGVRVVAQNSKGIFVSGAKMILTSAAIADELLVFNMPGLLSGQEDFAVSFAAEVKAPGLRLICRKSLVQPAYETFDHPLANSIDEIDSYLLLENVFVPWERVFVFRNVEKSNAFYDKTFMRNHTGHQGIVRGVAKIELVAGVALELAHEFGLNSQSVVQDQLGDVVSMVEVLRALVDRSESEAIFSENGILCPNILAVQATRLHFPRMYEKILQIIRSFAPGSMLSAPSQRDLLGPLGTTLMEALSVVPAHTARRVKLLNLAWDLVGDAFGQRQLIYEYYHAGAPSLISAKLAGAYDWSSERAALERGLML